MTGYSLVIDRLSDAILSFSLAQHAHSSVVSAPIWQDNRPQTSILADWTLADAIARPGFTDCVVAVPGVGLCVGCSAPLLYVVIPSSGPWQHIHVFAATHGDLSEFSQTLVPFLRSIIAESEPGWILMFLASMLPQRGSSIIEPMPALIRQSSDRWA